MREDVDKAYRVLYASYFPESGLMPHQDWLRTVRAGIRNTIEEVSEELEMWPLLRSDAKYFLLVNFDQMFLKPMAIQSRIYPDNFKKLIRQDIVSILKNAEGELLANKTGPNVSSPTDSIEISGHAVLAAITRIWPKLNVTSAKFWEDDGGMG
jgi:hypothetical protein